MAAKTIIVPQGVINPNTTTVIEIPAESQHESVFIANLTQPQEPPGMNCEYIYNSNVENPTAWNPRFESSPLENRPVRSPMPATMDSSLFNNQSSLSDSYADGIMDYDDIWKPENASPSINFTGSNMSDSMDMNMPMKLTSKTSITRSGSNSNMGGSPTRTMVTTTKLINLTSADRSFDYYKPDQSPGWIPRNVQAIRTPGSPSDMRYCDAQSSRLDGYKDHYLSGIEDSEAADSSGSMRTSMFKKVIGGDEDMPRQMIMPMPSPIENRHGPYDEHGMPLGPSPGRSYYKRGQRGEHDQRIVTNISVDDSSGMASGNVTRSSGRSSGSSYASSGPHNDTGTCPGSAGANATYSGGSSYGSSGAHNATGTCSGYAGGNVTRSGGGMYAGGRQLNVTGNVQYPANATYSGGAHNVTGTCPGSAGGNVTRSGGGMYAGGGQLNVTRNFDHAANATYSGGSSYGSSGINNVTGTCPGSAAANVTRSGGGMYAGGGQLNVTRNFQHPANATYSAGSSYGSSGINNVTGTCPGSAAANVTRSGGGMYAGGGQLNVTGNVTHSACPGLPNIANNATYSGGGMAGNATYSGGGMAGNATYSAGGMAGNATYSGGGMAGNATYSAGGLAGNATYGSGRSSPRSYSPGEICAGSVCAGGTYCKSAVIMGLDSQASSPYTPPRPGANMTRNMTGPAQRTSPPMKRSRLPSPIAPAGGVAYMQAIPPNANTTFGKEAYHRPYPALNTTCTLPNNTFADPGVMDRGFMQRTAPLNTTYDAGQAAALGSSPSSDVMGVLLSAELAEKKMVEEDLRRLQAGRRIYFTEVGEDERDKLRKNLFGSDYEEDEEESPCRPKRQAKRKPHKPKSPWRY